MLNQLPGWAQPPPGPIPRPHPPPPTPLSPACSPPGAHNQALGPPPPFQAALPRFLEEPSGTSVHLPHGSLNPEQWRTLNRPFPRRIRSAEKRLPGRPNKRRRDRLPPRSVPCDYWSIQQPMKKMPYKEPTNRKTIAGMKAIFYTNVRGRSESGL